MNITERSFRFLTLFFVCLMIVGGGKAYAAGDVLILDTTVSGGINSPEATEAQNLGLTVDVVNGTQWGAMTTNDFANYKAIILGDPTCGTDSSIIASAVANSNVWGPAITGNVIIIGADPSFHYGNDKADILVNRGIAFAVAESGKTGAYITLSCYYYNSSSNTPVPLLDAFSSGGFTVKGLGGRDSVHVVAEHPALAGLTDASLSNWGASTHEAFETWPGDFLVLALAVESEGNFTAPDGTVGTPYIIARGESLVVISDVDISPLIDTNPTGTRHYLTATVVEDDVPQEGVEVTFEVISGPHTGVTGLVTTDSNGQATFSYVGTTVGVDKIEARFLDSSERIQRSTPATKTWEAGCNEALTIINETLPSAPVGVNYSYQLDVTGGESYTWSIVSKIASDALIDDPDYAPTILDDLSIDENSGVLSWNPLPRITENPDPLNPIYYIDFTVQVNSGEVDCGTATYRYTDPDAV
ncbi:MAG: hypothetical protein Q7U10_05350, partial [Thermodesulfovibrionia bacterium]|nr:hypothetical protein [Thermodesulfovibrionia bacterium]